jgi:hypothetical protein
MARRSITFFTLLMALAPARTLLASEPAPTLFPKGTLTFQSYLTGGVGLDNHTALASTAVGAGYYVFDNVSLGAEVSAYGAWQKPSDAFAYGMAGVLRHHFLTFDRGTLFADVAFGPVEGTRRIPSAGTYFNFITRTGIGTTIQLRDNLYFLGGVRYLHLSNAQIEGKKRNPSINGIEGVVGLMWKL